MTSPALLPAILGGFGRRRFRKSDDFSTPDSENAITIIAYTDAFENNKATYMITFHQLEIQIIYQFILKISQAVEIQFLVLRTPASPEMAVSRAGSFYGTTKNSTTRQLRTSTCDRRKWLRN
ncbi:ATPase family AAA domain-containing protein 1-A [Fusarium oxysporum f. sp. albedinis]|nr:ATPase family AAA domain-containing protein 1-A [Fusarium oxysporum f. sp. albedinis]